MESEKTKAQEVAEAVERNLAANEGRSAIMALAAKQPAVVAYQKGEITAEEYEEITGETYATTMEKQYTAELSRCRDRMRTRAQAGLLTADEYQTITGEPYEG